MAATRRTFESRSHRAAFQSWRRMGICAALIAALGGSLLACRRQESDTERGMHALRNAFAKRRLIEPRLSGGFECGAYDPSDNTAGIDNKELNEAERLITDVAGRGVPSGDLAYGRFLLSRNEKLSEASKYLRRTLAAEPENAEAHNDLGVCLFQQQKLEEALGKFKAALEHEPDMPEALFNHALCYQRLLLRNAAREEFSRLVKIERDSGWRREIRQRQQEVSAPLQPNKSVEDFHTAFASRDWDGARKIQKENCETIVRHASLECPMAHLKQWLKGDYEKAENELSTMEFIGKGLVEAKGDTSVIDIANHLRGLTDADRERELKLLLDCKNLGNLIKGLPFDGAKAITERLVKDFEDLHSDFFQYSLLYSNSTMHYSRGRLQESIELLKQAGAIVERHQWPYHRLQILLQLALVEPRLGRDVAAIDYCDEVLQSAADLPLTRAKALQLKSRAYDNLGDRDKRLSNLRESSAIFLENVTTLKDMGSNYLGIAETYRTNGDDRLALLYSQESLCLLDTADDNRRAAEASAFAAVQCARLNQFDQSKEFHERASIYVRKIQPDERAYPEQYVLGCAAQIAEIGGDNNEAIRLYSKAVSVLENMPGEKLSLITILEARAEVYARDHKSEEARQDLMRAIDQIEHYRGNISQEQSRANFLDTQQNVFDQMIALEVRAFKGDREAFNFSEQSRARTLLDEFKGRQSSSSTDKQLTPLKLEAVKKALPPDVQLLTYSVTSVGTFLFLVTRTGLEVKESPVTTKELDLLVADYVSSLKRTAPLDEVNASARKLYDLLIAPVEGRIRDKTLCIAPDKALHFLPFAALVDSTSRYLFESCSLTYTPSASALALCAEESRSKGSNRDDETILSVGNPYFNHEQFPSLADLRDAETEASESAISYRHSTVLMREQATEERVKTALETCDVAHIAAHCQVREKSPWLAALVLADPKFETPAGRSKDDGLLVLDEVYNMNLPRTRLVVLSTCQSALGQYYRGEGIVSLIRPFLVVRVPMVVASLWPVDSQATSDLMIRFHQARKLGSGRAGDALRIAQMQMVRSDDYKHPYYWAPFIAVGSNN